eukprot:10532426-Karenia_brevis.AAC.1
MPLHEAEAVPMIYGFGPVGFQVAHTYTPSSDEAPVKGHYHFLQSWLPGPQWGSMAGDGGDVDDDSVDAQPGEPASSSGGPASECDVFEQGDETEHEERASPSGEPRTRRDSLASDAGDLDA